MKRLNTALLFCVLALFVSCKKYVVDVEPNFEGEWHAQPILALKYISLSTAIKGCLGVNVIFMGTNQKE